MSSIKRHNHRIHPCSPERKQELLKHLLTCNEASSILVVVSGESQELQELIDDKNIIVTNDASLADFPDLMRDLVISYDLPDDAKDYIKRISHASTHALILLDPENQIHLYPIETLLGRTLMQEVISGFEIEAEKPKEKFKRDERPNRNDKRPPRKYKDSDSRDSRDKKPYEKKKSYGEKKPYDGKGKGSYKSSKPTGSKKVGKRVSLKAVKPKETSD
ncbi:MAG: DEAD/DEAH box helicase [Campylobacterota bacterium]|nr:DEAD/DEAH box helicase [Campylobacterota bacterium]